MEIKFEYLPEHIIKWIIFYLPLKDLLKLSQTCSRLNQICKSNEIWKIYFEKYFNFDCILSEVKKAQEDCDFNFRDLCHNIFKRNQNNRQLLSLLCSSDQALADHELISRNDDPDSKIKELRKILENLQISSQNDDSGNLRASKAYMNLVNSLYCVSTDNDDEDSSTTDIGGPSNLNEPENFNVIIHAPSTSNFFDPSSSDEETGITTGVSKNIEENEKETKEIQSDVHHQKPQLDHHLMEYGFTSQQLQMRLQNLRNLSEINDNGNIANQMPGNFSDKFALKYRQE